MLLIAFIKRLIFMRKTLFLTLRSQNATPLTNSFLNVHSNLSSIKIQFVLQCKNKANLHKAEKLSLQID